MHQIFLEQKTKSKIKSFDDSDKGNEPENNENDTKMNIMDRNTKDKKKVDYEDIFENGDKAKDTENAENETKMNIQQPR